MERVRIDESITYLVPSRQASASFLGCCGLVVKDGRTVVIDGNMGPSETLPMLERERPQVCVVSHFHVDHSRWGHEAASIPGTVVYVPLAEKRYLADVDHFVERCGVPVDLAGGWKQWLSGFAGLKPVPHAVGLSPGEVIEAGRVRIEVMDAAGHSPGHQAYWIADRRILFCVDIGVDAFGPWYGWQDADLALYVGSIRRLAALDARLLVTSHGGLIDTDIETTLLGCIEVMRRREDCIRTDLDAGSSIEECAARGHIYGDVSRFVPPLDRMYGVWEANMVREHARIIGMGGLDAII